MLTHDVLLDELKKTLAFMEGQELSQEEKAHTLAKFIEDSFVLNQRPRPYWETPEKPRPDIETR